MCWCHDIKAYHTSYIYSVSCVCLWWIWLLHTVKPQDNKYVFFWDVVVVVVLLIALLHSIALELRHFKGLRESLVYLTQLLCCYVLAFVPHHIFCAQSLYGSLPLSLPPDHLHFPDSVPSLPVVLEQLASVARRLLSGILSAAGDEHCWIHHNSRCTYIIQKEEKSFFFKDFVCLSQSKEKINSCDQNK